MGSFPKQVCEHQPLEIVTTVSPHHLVEEYLDNLHVLVSGQQERATLFQYVFDLCGGCFVLKTRSAICTRPKDSSVSPKGARQRHL